MCDNIYIYSKKGIRHAKQQKKSHSDAQREQETLCGYIYRVPSTRHVEANTEEKKDLQIAKK